MLFRSVTANDGNRDRAAALLRFTSTTSAGTGELVSLQQYVDRAKEGQQQIYFACGTDQNAILRDPNLEVFRKRNLEVLVLTDPADEYIISSLGTFAEKKIVSIDAAELQLPPQSADEQSKEPAEQQKSQEHAAELDQLIGVFKEVLGERVQDVRRSERLTESVCCLVNAEGSMSTTMQRILRMNTPEFEMQKMILELNPTATLVQRLAALAASSTGLDFEIGRAHV